VEPEHFSVKRSVAMETEDSSDTGYFLAVQSSTTSPIPSKSIVEVVLKTLKDYGDEKSDKLLMVSTVMRKGRFVPVVEVSSEQAADILLNGDQFRTDAGFIQFEPFADDIVTVIVRRVPVTTTKQQVKKMFDAFGEVQTVRYTYWSDYPTIRDGGFAVTIKMQRKIPNFVTMGNLKVECRYKGVVVTCSKCCQEGHFAKDCRKKWVCPSEETVEKNSSSERNSAWKRETQ